MIYIESSVLLEAYLGQSRAAETRAVLALDQPRVSSWLLAIEIPVVLRRVLGNGRSPKLLKDALERFDADQKTFALYQDLPDIAERIRQDDRLARCRALDAFHVASALHIQGLAQRQLRIASFDERVRVLANAVGLEVLSH